MCVFWRLDPNFSDADNWKVCGGVKSFPVDVYCSVTTSFDFLFLLNFKRIRHQLTICLQMREFRFILDYFAKTLNKRRSCFWSERTRKTLFYVISLLEFQKLCSKKENSCTECWIETFDGAIFIESRLLCNILLLEWSIKTCNISISAWDCIISFALCTHWIQLLRTECDTCSGESFSLFEDIFGLCNGIDSMDFNEPFRDGMK